MSGHAAFEQFSRDAVAEAADFISTNVASYDNLWNEIKTEHVYRTGQAMATIYQPLEHYMFDYHQLSKNVGGCTPGGAKFTLNSDALALVRGPLTPDNLEKSHQAAHDSFQLGLIGFTPEGQSLLSNEWNTRLG